jgi:hypothetical protein
MKENKNTLAEDINELMEWLGKDYPIPDHKECKVFINKCNMIKENGKYYVTIDPDDIKEIELFEDQYQELKKRGYSWINLNCAGILDNNLLFSIELPRDTKGVPYGFTPINKSGPPFDIKNNKLNWEFKTNFKIL